MSSIYKSLVNNLSKLGFSLLISMALGIVLKAYMPRALGVNNVGMFYYADSLSYIFFTFLPLGIHTYINRVIPPNPSKAREIFRSIFIFMLAYGAILWLLLFAYTLILGFEAKKLHIILIIGIFQFFFFLVKDILKPIFVAADEVNFVSRIDVIHKFLQVSIVCIGLFLFSNLEVTALCFVSSQLITLLIYIFKAYRLGWSKGPLTFKYCREFLVIGLPFFINSALLSFYGNIDITMLERLTNFNEVGWYGASLQLKGIFMMVVPLLQTVIMPLLSKVHAKDATQFTEFSSNIYGILNLASWFLAIVMCCFANEFVILLYGDDFIPATRSMILLTPVILFTYMNVFLSMLLNLVSNGKSLVMTTMASLILNMILNFFLIPWGLNHWGDGGGGVGASITTILAEMTVFLILLKLTPIPLMNGINLIGSSISFLVIASLIVLLLSKEWSFIERLWMFFPYLLVSGLIGIILFKKMMPQLRSH